MKRFRWCLILTWMGLLATTMGCSNPQPQAPDPDVEAKAKVEAFNKLADAMAKDPNGADARAALENFRVTMLDVKKNPTQAQEIVEVYRQRIKGKYQGEVAQDVQMEVTGIEAGLKANK